MRQLLRQCGSPLLSFFFRIFCGLVFLAGACGTVETRVTPLNPAPHEIASHGFEWVSVYSSAPPARPHVDVALLEAEQSYDPSRQGTGLMIQRLRERAGAMGCDAIVLGGMRERGGNRHGFDSGGTTMHATCIVYKE